MAPSEFGFYADIVFAMRTNARANLHCSQQQTLEWVNLGHRYRLQAPLFRTGGRATLQLKGKIYHHLHEGEAEGAREGDVIGKEMVAGKGDGSR